MRLAHGRPSARPAPTHRERERGETLIELMVAVIIMGISIVAILGAISTMIITSGEHRGLVRTGNEATRIAELVQLAAYKKCTAAVPNPVYQSALDTWNADPLRPHGYVATFGTTLNLQDRGGPSADPPYNPSFGTSCPTTDQGVQKVTITVTAGSADGKSQQTITIVKRSSP